MKTNPIWATDEYAREVAQRKIWSYVLWSSRKIHAFLRVAVPSDLPADQGSDDLKRRVALGERMVSACYAGIRNRLDYWSHGRYFLEVEHAYSQTSSFALDTTPANSPWHIEKMCLGCRKAIFKGSGPGYGVCADYD